MSVSCQENPAAFADFLHALAQNVPCEECKEHFSKYLESNPPVFSSMPEAAQYVFTFHNSVNARMGKRLFSPEEFKRQFGQVVVGEPGSRPAARPALRVEEPAPSRATKRRPSRDAALSLLPYYYYHQLPVQPSLRPRTARSRRV